MRLLRAFWFGLQMLGAALASVALIWLAAQWLFGFRLLNVQTGSMRPGFSPGDALIMRPIGFPQVRPGMVVAYHSPRNPDNLITHRVVWVDNTSFQTKGDAVIAADPPVRGSLLAGQVTVTIPGMGRLLGWLTGWQGLATCVYLPATLMIVGELIRLERAYARSSFYRLGEA